MIFLDETMIERLQQLRERYQELALRLSDPEMLADPKSWSALSKEYNRLTPLIESYHAYERTQKRLVQAQAALSDYEPELQALAQEEIQHHKAYLEQLGEILQEQLLPKELEDVDRIYLEIRAGTGGHEAALFVGSLLRMYTRYAEQKGWSMDMVHAHLGEVGGFKEVIIELSGEHIYAQLKFESGVHRVQRVPDTEAQGRIHTSACTVAVLPVLEEIESIELKTDELRIDTYRASGAGGQHVNKTDSAIRITHLPTGMVVECQQERSQLKNRSKALQLLKSRLLAKEHAMQQEAQTKMRRSLVGSGDRSERIRTYNFPQNRLTDHRIQLTLYKLDEILEGALDLVLIPLQHRDKVERLIAAGIKVEASSAP